MSANTKKSVFLPPQKKTASLSGPLAQLVRASDS